MIALSQPGIGEPAPWFSAKDEAGHIISFDELAGRYIVLFFFGSAGRSDAAEMLATRGGRSGLFDGDRTLLVGVGRDPDDFRQARLQGQPGQLFLFDSTGAAARQYGVVDPAPSEMTAGSAAFVLSPALQILEIVPLADTGSFWARVESTLKTLLADAPDVQGAPVLVVPQVFDREFCRRLIGIYDAAGGREIGAIENQGKIVERFDQQFRRRLDHYISDEQALQRSRELLSRRLLPMVYRAFQFRVTRIERYLVGCYDATTGGYFRPHRDNTAPIVAHRRFAVTINLNEGYEGGDLSFPEYGHRTYRTSPGDAIVFSCSLLHEVTPVTRDRRYAFISFLYDEPSQRIRDEYRRAMGSQQPD